MTKKEMNINMRNITRTSYICNSRNTVVVENYNKKYAASYGDVDSMMLTRKEWSKLAKKLYFADHQDKWGGAWLTPIDIDPEFAGKDIKFCLIRKADVKEIWLKNYVVLKSGGVYSIRANYWYTKKDFYGIRNLYNKGLTHQDFNGYGVEHVTLCNKDYFKYYEDLENQWRDGLLNHEE